MPVRELGEISRRMFFAYGAVGSSQSGLDISKHRIDPFEGRFLGRVCASAGYDLGMRAASFRDCGKACKPIGNNLGFRIEGLAGKLLDRALPETGHTAKKDLIGLTLFSYGHGGNEGRFARGTAPPLSGALAAQIGVVHLHHAS
jgi:hypothetical protein